MEPNPNGANGSVSDPREQVMWDLYVKKNLENAYQCALEAGYEESSAIKITTRDWFVARLQKLKRKEMLSDAEKVLQKTLKYKTEKDDGEIKTDLLRVQTDVAKHITKTLGKDEGYSERTEHTGKDGENLLQNSQDLDKLAEEVSKRLKEKKLNDTQSRTA